VSAPRQQILPFPLLLSDAIIDHRRSLTAIGYAATFTFLLCVISVHRLRVGDIDVVGAIGDSLTAGNGVLAWTVLGCLTEYRGRSWR